MLQQLEWPRVSLCFVADHSATAFLMPGQVALYCPPSSSPAALVLITEILQQS